MATCLARPGSSRPSNAERPRIGIPLSPAYRDSAERARRDSGDAARRAHAAPAAAFLEGSQLLVQPMMMITENIAFATQILLAFGVVFEVPVVVSFLSLAGMVNWRQLLTFGRWWVVIASVLAAVLTPTPDAGSMMLRRINSAVS